MSVGQQRYLMSLCQHLLAIPTFWWVFEVSCKSDSYQMEKMSVVGKAKRVESPSHCCCQCQCQCLASSHHWLSDEGSPSLMNANAAVKPIYVTHLRSVNVNHSHAVNSPSYMRHHHCEKAISTQLLFQFIFSYACIQKSGFLYNWFADIFIQYDDDQQQLEKLQAASFLGWIFPVKSFLGTTGNSFRAYFNCEG